MKKETSTTNIEPTISLNIKETENVLWLLFEALKKTSVPDIVVDEIITFVSKIIWDAYYNRKKTIDLDWWIYREPFNNPDYKREKISYVILPGNDSWEIIIEKSNKNKSEKKIIILDINTKTRKYRFINKEILENNSYAISIDGNQLIYHKPRKYIEGRRSRNGNKDEIIIYTENSKDLEQTYFGIKLIGATITKEDSLPYSDEEKSFALNFFEYIPIVNDALEENRPFIKQLNDTNSGFYKTSDDGFVIWYYIYYKNSIQIVTINPNEIRVTFCLQHFSNENNPTFEALDYEDLVKLFKKIDFTKLKEIIKRAKELGLDTSSIPEELLPPKQMILKDI